ncbi:MAG: biopolymer transporter ExbD [Bacteroidales bacterium]|jgi:biopolymer transport protein ExbD|nr:biopolymer transporter ExbD [Bacteroidales bacterium]
MAIQLQNKRSAEFSSCSMSDLVFLLLIFFMITSTLVAPNAINLLLPKSDSGKELASRNIEVYIDSLKNYYVNPEGNTSLPTPYEELLPLLQEAAANDLSEQKAIVLRADKSVPVENVVALMDVLNALNEELPVEGKYKIVLATVPKD